MELIDWILNVAGVFLWMDWRSAWSVKPQSALSIASVARPTTSARPAKGLGSLVALLVILLVRPIFYYSIGSSVNWIPTSNFLAVAVPWRSDMLGRMFLFSTLSFARALGVYYAWLFLFSAANRHVSNEDPIQRFIRGQLGWLEKIPWWLKLLLPSAISCLAWVGLSQLFMELALMPPRPIETRWGQAAAFALAALLVWKSLLVVLFLLHMLNIYVFLGTHPIWPFISGTARRLLWPFSFLKFGKADISPVAGIAAVFALSYWVIEPLVTAIYQRFP